MQILNDYSKLRRRTGISLVALLGLLSCAGADRVSIACQPIFAPEANEAVPVTKWQVISGAVWSDEGDEEALYKELPDAADVANLPLAEVAPEDGGWLNLARHVPLKAGSTRGLAVVAFDISPSKRPLFLSIASADGVSISVNGLPLIRSWERDDYKTRLSTVRHPLRFTEVCAIPISKGRSRVVIRVPNRREFWLVRATLASTPEALVKASANRAGFSFLKNHLLENDTPPELDLGVSQVAQIEGFVTDELASRAIRLVRIRVGSSIYYEAVLSQNVDRIRGELETKDNLFGLENTAYKERARVLLDALPSQSFKDGVFQKIARTLARMDPKAAKLIPSDLHLRGFLSEIDGARQYYAISESPNNSGKYVIYMPFVQHPAREFLGSWFVAASEISGQLADAARESGYGVVFPFCRGNSYGNPIGEADLDEVIEDVRRRGAVRSLTLYGECSSGMSAIMAAEKSPNVANLAVANPIGERLASHWPLMPGGIPSSRRWLTASSLYENMREIRGKRLLIIHDDGIPHSPPFQVSSAIAELAKKNGATTEIVRLTPWSADAIGRFRIACRWFSSADADRGGGGAVRFSGEVAMGKRTRLQGPLLQAFSKPFLLSYEKGDESFANLVVDGWVNRKFTIPRMKHSTSVTEADRAAFSVIRILPVGADQSDICEEIKRRLVARYGERIGIVVFCRPNDADKYDVFIMRTSRNVTSFPSIDFSLDGTWDYMVFGAGSNEFLGGGFFSADWGSNDI